MLIHRWNRRNRRSRLRWCNRRSPRLHLSEYHTVPQRRRKRCCRFAAARCSRRPSHCNRYRCCRRPRRKGFPGWHYTSLHRCRRRRYCRNAHKHRCPLCSYFRRCSLRRWCRCNCCPFHRRARKWAILDRRKFPMKRPCTSECRRRTGQRFSWPGFRCNTVAFFPKHRCNPRRRCHRNRRRPRCCTFRFAP